MRVGGRRPINGSRIMRRATGPIMMLLVALSLSTSPAVLAAPSAARRMIVTFKYREAARLARQQAVQHSPAIQSGAVPAQRLTAERYITLTSAAYRTVETATLRAHPGVQVIEDYSPLPIAYVEIDSAAEEEALRNDSRVVGMSPNQSYAAEPPIIQHNALTSPSLVADLEDIDDIAAQASGDLGQGTSVAVLDDGTEYLTNFAFGTCTHAGSPGCSVAAYKRFGKAPTSGLGWDEHGTNVAGLVLKVAPKTQLVVGNVFTKEKNGHIEFDKTTLLNGLSWVTQLAPKHNIRAVNLSLGVHSTYYTAACSSGTPGAATVIGGGGTVLEEYAAAFNSLLAINVQPVVAAGNIAYSNGVFEPGIQAPACSPGALAVGAVYAQGAAPYSDSSCKDDTSQKDQIVCFSQAGSLVGVLAPGVEETAAGVTETGTSQATPLVSGAIAALASGSASTSSEEISSMMHATGDLILDPRTNEEVPRLNVLAAKLSLEGGAVIKTARVGLGVTQWGDLNVRNQQASTQGTTTYGLRYLRSNNDFTGPGCLCEGWGVADLFSGADGYADGATGTSGLQLIAFTHDTETAASEVHVGSTLDVVHAYSPVPNVPDLFQDKVTITNISGEELGDLVYRRLVDWDMEPTAFDEFVTIEGYGNSPHLSSTTNDGFDSADPISPSNSLGATGNVVRFGPSDQGAQFNFDFGALPTGASIKFTEYYGAAVNQKAAYHDLKEIGAEAYSLGEPNTSLSIVGFPNTAMLAFTGIGGGAALFPK